MPDNALPWTRVENESELTMILDTTIYPLEAIQRACYWLTDRCHVLLEPAERPQDIRARLVSKAPRQDMREIAGEFGNRVLDEELRRQIRDETKTIRDLIVTQAFAEAELDDDRGGDYIEDPKAIGR